MITQFNEYLLGNEPNKFRVNTFEIKESNNNKSDSVQKNVNKKQIPKINSSSITIQYLSCMFVYSIELTSKSYLTKQEKVNEINTVITSNNKTNISRYFLK